MSKRGHNEDTNTSPDAQQLRVVQQLLATLVPKHVATVRPTRREYVLLLRVERDAIDSIDAGIYAMALESKAVRAAGAPDDNHFSGAEANE